MSKRNFFKILISTGLLCSSAVNVFASATKDYLDIDSIVEIQAEEMVPKTLEIIYPKKIETTKEDTIYIAGTSDPSKPLYVNNQEIVDRASNGMFEVVLLLPNDGKYNCVFSQEGQEKVVPVFKNIAVDKSYANFSCERPVVKNECFLDGPAYPTQSIILKDKKIKICCIAPSGASVEANLCGETFKLKQEKEIKEFGDPVNYSLEVDLSNYFYLDDDKTYDFGNITYIIDFNEEITKKVSFGRIYCSNKSPDIARVSWEYGMLRNAPNCSNSGDISVLKRGVLDKIVGEEKDFYKLACGGWIAKKFVEPIFGNADLDNKITEVDFNQDEKSEVLSLKGVFAPVFTSTLGKDTENKDKLIIRLFSTNGNLDLSSLSDKSELFDTVVAENKTDYLELTFSLKNNNSLWGYNIEFDEDTTFIYLKKRPTLSENSLKPLENITVLVDAGHGGSDPGALGLVGEVGGGKEKDINLANALALKNRLISLGANVVMTRDNDKYISLSDRATLIEKTKPDFVVVLHADSATNIKANGNTVYYTKDNKFSKSFSSLVSDAISEYTGRAKRGEKLENFYVSRNTFCPTAFIEVGFLTNFEETSQLFTSKQVFDLANAVGNSIINYLSDNINLD